MFGNGLDREAKDSVNLEKVVLGEQGHLDLGHVDVGINLERCLHAPLDAVIEHLAALDRRLLDRAGHIQCVVVDVLPVAEPVRVLVRRVDVDPHLLLGLLRHAAGSAGSAGALLSLAVAPLPLLPLLLRRTLNRFDLD